MAALGLLPLFLPPFPLSSPASAPTGQQPASPLHDLQCPAQASTRGGTLKTPGSHAACFRTGPPHPSLPATIPSSCPCSSIPRVTLAKVDRMAIHNRRASPLPRALSSSPPKPICSQPEHQAEQHRVNRHGQFPGSKSTTSVISMLHHPLPAAKPMCSQRKHQAEQRRLNRHGQGSAACGSRTGVQKEHSSLIHRQSRFCVSLFSTHCTSFACVYVYSCPCVSPPYIATVGLVVFYFLVVVASLCVPLLAVYHRAWRWGGPRQGHERWLLQRPAALVVLLLLVVPFLCWGVECVRGDVPYASVAPTPLQCNCNPLSCLALLNLSLFSAPPSAARGWASGPFSSSGCTWFLSSWCI